jgi:elongation factor Ts
MAITTAQIKELRDATGVGILDCRTALEVSDGDMDKALDYLRERGLAKAAKRAGRAASEGVIEQYSHGDGRVGVMVEINCETDFVGRSEQFRHLAHEIALQIAAAAPLFISEENIPQEALDREIAVATAKARAEGKPEQIIPRIVEGFIKSYKEDNVLLNQAYIRDESKKVQDLIAEAVASCGENIVVRRFVRWGLGETSSEETDEE